MVLSTLGLLFKTEEIFSRFSFIYLGFCLNVEQPYMIITKTSQTLSSKSKMKEFLCLYENDFDYFKYQWTLLKKHMKLLRNRKRRSLDFFYYFILFYD